MAKARYGREVLRRAGKDWTGGNWLLRALGVSILALVISRALGLWKVAADAMANLPGWTQPLIAPSLALILWGLLSFLYSLLRAPGKLLGERDACLEGLRAEIAQFKEGMDAVLVTLMQWDDVVYLVVENNGPPTEFWAKLLIDGPTTEAVPRDEIFAQWADALGSRISIDRGRRKRIKVGYKADVVVKKKWAFPYILKKKPLTTKSVFGWGAFGALPKPSAEEENLVTVEILADPEMRGGPVRRQIRFRADEAAQI